MAATEMVEVALRGCDVETRVELDIGMHEESQERIPEFTSSLAKVETSLIALLAPVAAREDSCAHVTADQEKSMKASWLVMCFR